MDDHHPQIVLMMDSAASAAPTDKRNKFSPLLHQRVSRMLGRSDQVRRGFPLQVA
jgi:hypothetical protein